jgi:hypothetical protein
MASHAIVTRWVVCDQAEIERPRGRVETAFVGEAVGDSLSLLERVVMGLLGERSGGGNCFGWLRVDTMVCDV